jgi:hypothetical protein
VVSTSTALPDLTLEDALQKIPAPLRSRVLNRYRDLKRAFLRGEYDACGLRVGRLCELLLRAAQHELTGSHTPLGEKISNFTDECRKLERLPANTGPEPLRIIVPRALNFAYTLRNKRGFGHEGGDVDANEIDAAVAVRIADWCIAELVRILHSLSLEEAQALLDGIAERELPIMWTVGGRKRVLNPSLTYKEQTLLLLYADVDEPIVVEDLFDWTEHSHLPSFRRDVLKPLHRSRLIEYDRENETVQLSPRGAAQVEEELLPKAGLLPAT